MTLRYLSLFSGMEAAHLAWSPLGWECVGVAEIDPSACALLAERLPSVPNLGSVTDISDGRIAALGPIDVVIGGSPCQDLSVAGKRKGLAGARSSLFHEQVRIFHAARHFCGARWLAWENVPGTFSSHAGRDFAVVVGTLAGLSLDVPRDGWGTEGVCLGPNGLVEWSVLDAQWFGLAQRRKRVFAVLDSGKWPDRSPVLLERESLRGDSPPSRKARKDVAGSLACHPARCRGDDDGQVIPEVSFTLTTGVRMDGETETFIPEIAHALRADGFDASEDGMGRGTPLVPVVSINSLYGDDVARTPAGVGKNYGLSSGARDEPIQNGVIAPIAFDTTQITSPENRSNPQVGDPRHPLVAHAHAPAIAYAFDARQKDVIQYGDKSGPLDTNRGTVGVLCAYGVRRLTPRECERLQGAPDEWTLYRKGKSLAKDGPRYKLIGNSFAVPVIRWIGEQIERAVSESAAREP